MRKPIAELIGSSNLCHPSQSVVIIIRMDSSVFLNGAHHWISVQVNSIAWVVKCMCLATSKALPQARHPVAPHLLCPLRLPATPRRTEEAESRRRAEELGLALRTWHFQVQSLTLHLGSWITVPYSKAVWELNGIKYLSQYQLSCKYPGSTNVWKLLIPCSQLHVKL